jgi:hypothetical protein
MGPELISAALSATVLLVLALCIVGWLTRNASAPDRQTRWAGSHGVAVTDGNRALVVWWVQLSATLRVVGGVSGLVLGALFDRAFALSTSTGLGFWIWIVLGWVTGGTWAWEVVTKASAAPAGSASLVPRVVADYVPAALRWAPAGAAVITVAIAASGRWLAPVTDPRGYPVGSPTDRWLIALGATLIAVTARLLVARVVARRQTTTDLDLVAVDDAIRATTVHLVTGGATAAILLLGATASELVLQARQLPYGIRGWLPLVLVLGAWMSSRYLANRPWRVRRPGLERRAVAP